MRNLLGMVVGFAGVLTGCGSTDHIGPVAMAGTSAAGTSPTGGVAAGGAAVAGGASGGAGGGSPSAGSSAGGAGTGPLPTRADVDLTLGGLNQDLAPTPATCEVAGGIGCISVSGEVGGKKFSATCQNSDAISGAVGGRRQLHCSPNVAGDGVTGFSLTIFLDGLGEPTSLFSYQSPVGQVPKDEESMALFWLKPSGFSNYDPLEPASTTHDELVKIAALNYDEAYISDKKKSKYVFGAFAATWTPQASCVDCPLVRLYVRFNVVYQL
jgi:hypothetical protein